MKKRSLLVAAVFMCCAAMFGESFFAGKMYGKLSLGFETSTVKVPLYVGTNYAGLGKYAYTSEDAYQDLQNDALNKYQNVGSSSTNGSGVTTPTVDITTVGIDAVGMFVLKPTFGMKLFPQDKNLFLKGLAVEASLDFAFGGKNLSVYKESVFMLMPGVKALWGYEIPKTKIVPHTGLGFSIPIQFVTVKYSYPGVEKSLKKTSGGFVVDWVLGCDFGITDKIGIVADCGLSFGTSFIFTINAGATYKF